MGSAIRKLKFDQAGIDGIKVFLSDFGYMESYRSQDLVGRFNAIARKFGVNAENYTEDVLLPSSGASNDTVYISAGTCLVPNGGLITLETPYSFAVSGSDVGKWVVAQHVTMNIDPREHRETGSIFYMREVPTSGLTSVFFTTSTPPTVSSTGDMVWLGKITAITGSKPVIDASATNRQLWSVFTNSLHDYILWVYQTLNSNRSDFEDLINVRYAQLVDLLDNKLLPNGETVDIVDDVPVTLKNLRVSDISAPNSWKGKLTEEVKVTQASEFFATQNLNVKFKWGYDNIIGTGGANTFTITSSGASFGSNELADYYFWFPSIAKNLLIVSNTATSGGSTVCTVSETDGSSWNGTGVVIDSANYGWIHHNVDEYELVLIPYTTTPSPAQYHYDKLVQKTVRYKTLTNAPVIMEQTFLLQTNLNFLVKMRTRKGDTYSNWVSMDAGSFTKYSIAQNYLNPLTIDHPDISDTGASIGATATTHGFRVTISGWSDAELFEVAYTTNASGPDFSTLTSTRIITPNRTVDITSSVRTTYYIKVRPLIGGFQVSTPISTDVASGGGGVLPNDQILISQSFTHYTYQGTPDTILTLSAPEGKYFLRVDTSSSGNLYSPAGDMSEADLVWVRVLDSSFVGMILTDTNTGADFVITSIVAQFSFGPYVAFILQATSGSVGGAPLFTGGFTIGTSKRARQLYRSNNYIINYDIVQVSVNCKVLKGDDVTLRIYQAGKESSAGTMILNQSDTHFVQDMQVALTAQVGSRDLVIDLWDPSDTAPLNNGCFMGNVTVIVRPQAGLDIGDDTSKYIKVL